MRMLQWLYDNVLNRSSKTRELKKLDELELERKSSRDDIQGVKSKYQFDLMFGDATAQNMMLE